jgi:uncharacterized protein
MPSPHPLTIAIVSDTHGQLDGRIAALVRDCDYAVHAGDILGAGVLSALQPRRSILAVRGNNDVPHKWPRADAAILHDLPLEAELELPGGTLAVTHGDRQFEHRDRHGRLRAHFPTARVIVYGHSHFLTIDQSATPWVVNPGAAGRTRTHGGPSCLILTATRTAWHVEARRFELLPVNRVRTAV